MTTVIFDIDGTLADASDRLHLLKSTTKDWDKFHKESVKDKPIKELKRLHQCISDSNMEIVYVTARPEKYRELTEKWLHNNIQCSSSSWPLYMRKDSDFRPAEVVKEEILNTLRKTGRNVSMAFDDNKACIKMFRENGVMAFHHVDDEPISFKNRSLPHLTVIIGTAGAGKTTFIKQHLSEVSRSLISTDNIRRLMTGSEQDQTRNDDVFTYAARLLQLNNEFGISSIIDATNLKWKYRKRWVNLMPKDAEITYVVVDRPLEDKIASGGWRNSVVMTNGKTLIEYHQEVFSNNYYNILDGDGLDNVSVLLYTNNSVKPVKKGL